MGAGRYDVIVVGARVAGAATAMLLARQGLRVLAVDRVSFPSDTISSHQLQVPGAALLQRWGLLGKLAAAGTPPARRVRFDAGGGLVMNGQFPAYEGVDALYSPRRTLLDSILVEAAREAGAEIRENFRVTQVTASGDRVTGIRGSARGRPLADALRNHQRQRDRAIRGMYDFTLGLAAFPRATSGQRRFLAAVAPDQRETDRFLGAFAGIVPPEQYFTPRTAVRVLGSRAIRQLTANHLFRPNSVRTGSSLGPG